MASKYCDRVKSCKHSWWCADDYNPERDSHECFIQLTNADRIRSMSDEELCTWFDERYALAPWCSGKQCPPVPIDREEDCRKCVMDWLKSKAEVE